MKPATHVDAFFSHARIALLLALTFGATPAFAITLCVTNSAQLQTALDDISDGGIYSGTDSSNTILIVKGLYKTGAVTQNTAFHYSSTVNQTLDVVGGYRGACPNPTASLDPTISVLDGNHAQPVLDIHSAIGTVSVWRLTIQNGQTNGNPAGLSINSHTGDNSGANVRNNIIQNNIATNGLFGGLFVASGSSALLQVQNNLIANNHADNGYGAGAVVANGGQLGVYANTVTGNTVTMAGETGGLTCSSTGFGSIVGNIFWNNSNAGLDLAAGSISLAYNDIGTLAGVPPQATLGDVSVTPKFVDAANGNYRLAGNSPLLAASDLTEGDFDLDGNHYPAHGKVDIGAYEETIFINGFDGG